MTVGPSRFERQANDLYQTEAWAVRALLGHYPVAGLSVWEPAAGGHAIVDVLREAGAARVWSSDVATYDRPHDEILDFLAGADEARDFGAIITNPPYGKGNRDATRFAERALRRCRGVVALLLTAKWDSGRSRLHLTRDHPRFAGKVTLVDRVQWFAGASSGTEDHAWFVWRPVDAPVSPPVLRYAGKR